MSWLTFVVVALGLFCKLVGERGDGQHVGRLKGSSEEREWKVSLELESAENGSRAVREVHVQTDSVSGALSLAVSMKGLIGAGSVLATCLNPDGVGFYLESQLGLGDERKVNYLE